MKTRLTREEQEAVFLNNQASKNCMVSTCDPALIRKLDSLSEKDPCVVRVCATETCSEYQIPKRYLRVKPPRQYSEEERREMAERMRAMRNRINTSQGGGEQ